MAIRPGKVYHADALSLLRMLPAECIDAVITDPMFGTGQYDWGPDPAQGDPHRHWQYHQRIYLECLRVLRPGGILVWGAAGNSCRFFGQWFGRHRVWSLTRIGLKNLLGVANVWVVQTKERQPVEFPTTDPLVICDRGAFIPLRQHHPYPKPAEEMSFLIRHLTSPGQIVLDCFAGLGSTLVAAQKLGRQWIGCDLSRAYCRIALRRLAGLEVNTTPETRISVVARKQAWSRPELPAIPSGPPSVQLTIGNALDEMPKLRTGSVDLLLTDGPYAEIDRPYGRLSEKDWLTLMQRVVQEARRIVKPTGSAVFITQPNYSTLGVTRLWPWRFLLWAGTYWNLVEDLYWNAPDTPPVAGTGRKYGLLKRACRPIIWLGDPECYRRQDAVLAQPAAGCYRRRGDDSQVSPSGYTRNSNRMHKVALERGGSVPGNILTISKSAGSPGSNGHPAILPLAVAEWLVRYLLPPGGTLLDCFCGSGTVLEAGVANGAAEVIGIDIVPEYIATCRERLRHHR